MNTKIVEFISRSNAHRQAVLDSLASIRQNEGVLTGPVIAAMWLFGWPLLIL